MGRRSSHALVLQGGQGVEFMLVIGVGPLEVFKLAIFLIRFAF